MDFGYVESPYNPIYLAESFKLICFKGFESLLLMNHFKRQTSDVADKSLTSSKCIILAAAQVIKAI